MIVIRSFLFYIVFFGGTAILSLIGGVMRLVVPTKLLPIAVAWSSLGIWSARVICGIRLDVSGQENLPPGPALIASRHQSAFDTLVWFTLLPRCCYVLKKELLRIPLMGPLMKATDMIAVDREGGARTIRELVRQGQRVIQDGRQIVIFPEGTRAPPGALLPLQPGVAALATRTKMPVIPVITDSGLRWGRRAFHKYPGTIHVKILPALPVGLPRDELMERLKHALEQTIDPPTGPVGNSVS